jgi:hypothetical protein
VPADRMSIDRPPAEKKRGLQVYCLNELAIPCWAITDLNC